MRSQALAVANSATSKDASKVAPAAGDAENPQAADTPVTATAGALGEPEKPSDEKAEAKEVQVDEEEVKTHGPCPWLVPWLVGISDTISCV